MSKINMTIVPNVEQIAREMTGSSQVIIILKRIIKLAPTAILRFGINNLSYVSQILQKDFAAGIKVLCELEILNRMGSGKKHFVLHNQMVDMAVALKNKRIITYFFVLAKKYGFRPGLLTYNAELLIKMLGDVPSIPKDLVIYTRIISGSALGIYVKNSPIEFEDWRN